MTDVSRMDIAATATAMSSAQIGNAIDVSVAKKTLDTAKTQGMQMVGLIEKAALPDPSGNLGNSIDVMG